MQILTQIIKSMRPKQWTKNGVIFAALIFSKNLFDVNQLLAVCITFILFCMTSGSVYLLNDIVDRERDRLHPKKCNRPIASGQLPIRMAVITLIGLVIIAQGVAWILTPLLFALMITYFLMNILYSFRLKHIVIIDILIIAIGFVIRAVAGAVVISVKISPWLVICAFLLALFLALAKRRNELKLSVESPDKHRQVLSEYSLEMIDHMISIVAATTIMAYSLYTFDDRTIETFHTQYLSMTIPFVVYGIFRYLYLIHKRGLGGSPELILLSDKGILINTALWLIVSVALIYLKL